MERSPYYNLEVEEALIGSLFLDGDLIKDCTIRPEHLYVSKLRMIFTLMMSLVEKGKPIDMLSVAEEAGSKFWDTIGGGSYLSALAGSVPSTANLAYYEEIVKKYYQKRKTVEIVHRIKQGAAEHEDIETILHDGIHDLQRVEDHLSVEDQGDIKQGLIKYCME